MLSLSTLFSFPSASSSVTISDSGFSADSSYITTGYTSVSSVTFHHSVSVLHPTKNPDEGVYAGGSADSPYLTVWLSTAFPSVPMNLTAYSACSNSADMTMSPVIRISAPASTTVPSSSFHPINLYPGVSSAFPGALRVSPVSLCSMSMFLFIQSTNTTVFLTGIYCASISTTDFPSLSLPVAISDVMLFVLFDQPVNMYPSLCGITIPERSASPFSSTVCSSIFSSPFSSV